MLRKLHAAFLTKMCICFKPVIHCSVQRTRYLCFEYSEHSPLRTMHWRFFFISNVLKLSDYVSVWHKSPTLSHVLFLNPAIIPERIKPITLRRLETENHFHSYDTEKNLLKAGNSTFESINHHVLIQLRGIKTLYNT
jgi:hypothetical protein